MGLGKSRFLNLGNKRAHIFTARADAGWSQSNDVCHELTFTKRGRLRGCN